MSIELNDEAKWSLLSLKRQEVALSEVFNQFRSHMVEPILIKGWAAARNYPVGHYRNSVDIDLAVAGEDFAKAFEISRSVELASHYLDVHCELRHFDKTPWSDLFQRSLVVNVEGGSIRLLSPEDHLCVLAAHWLNDGGEYRERLWDIYYAVSNRPENFDWDLCLNSAGQPRRNWIATAIMIAHKYLDLDITEIPLSGPETSLPIWVSRTLETEWKSDVRLRPLSSVRGDKRLYWQQIRKRLPPNPIEATIESGAMFEERSPLLYQVRTGLRRLIDSSSRALAKRRGNLA